MDRRISVDNVLEIARSSNKWRYTSVKNIWIDFYLDGFKKRRRKTENKSIVLLNWFTFFSWMVCLAKFIVCLVLPLSYETKLVLFDLSMFIGGIEVYNKVVFISMSTIGIAVNYVLRLMDSESADEWTQVFEMTRSRVQLLFLFRHDRNEVLAKMIRAMSLMYKTITPSIILFGTMGAATRVWVCITFYNWRQFLLSSVFQLTEPVLNFAFFIDAIVIYVFSIILSYYEHIRLNKINDQLEQVYHKLDKDQTTHEVYCAVKRFTEDHNRYCTHILVINDFWKYIALTFFVTSLPLNLILMHQLFFEDIDFYMKIFYVYGIILDDIMLFGVQYFFASLSKKIHKMAAKLSRLQWSINGYPFRMRTKLKLLMCFERLASNKKIGLTMGSIVFTLPLFCKIVVKYSRFFILTHKVANKLR